MRLLLLGLMFALLACTGCAVQRSIIPPTNDDERQCAPPAGWGEIAAQAEGKALFFGEVHGTREGVDFFRRYVCAAAFSGGRTLVLLEIIPAYADGLDAGFASERPREVWLSEMAGWWFRPFQDGRSSSSMLDLLLFLDWIKRRAGVDLDVDVVMPRQEVFERAGRPAGPGWAYSTAASRIEDALKGYDRVVVLAGNVHPPAYKRYLGGRAILLLQVVTGGTAWHCASEGCGLYSLGRSSRFPDGLDKSVGELMKVDPSFDASYDGYYFLGEVNYSPPVPK